MESQSLTSTTEGHIDPLLLGNDFGTPTHNPPPAGLEVLRQVRTMPAKRKRTRPQGSGTAAGAETDDEQLRKLDQLIRWDSLMYCSTFREDELIRQCYGIDISPDAQEYMYARTKIYDNVKGYKSRTLLGMEVC